MILDLRSAAVESNRLDPESSRVDLSPALYKPPFPHLQDGEIIVLPHREAQKRVFYVMCAASFNCYSYMEYVAGMTSFVNGWDIIHQRSVT